MEKQTAVTGYFSSETLLLSAFLFTAYIGSIKIFVSN